MAKISKQWLTVTLVAVPVVLAAVGLTVLRAPNATVEGYGDPIGIDGAAPAQEFAAALKDFPVTIGEQSFTADELGVSPESLPEIPRAWSFGAWGEDLRVPLKVDEEKRNTVLAGIEGYGAAVDGAVAYDGASWVATPSAPGLELSQDLPEAISQALAAGEKSVALELKQFEPTISSETAQAAADALNGASVKILGGATELASLDSAAIAGLVSVAARDGALTIEVNAEAVGELAATYSTLAQDKVDGEAVVGDDGAILKTITAPRDGFKPGSPEQISEALTASLSALLEAPVAELQLPGEVDAAKPRTLNRSAVVDASDHTAIFYENGVEVARFPIAVGKPGYETDRGTFKVYAQLPSQHMGSCDSAGNFVRGTSVDYCTANVPWISYFNGDEGFHGAYWHSNFGNPSSNMSHGCVNMRVEDAEWVYRFLQVGSTVTVQD